jgi:zinc protease
LTINRPTPSPSREYHFPRFERGQLENGLSFIVAPVRKLPVVTIAVVVDAGATHDAVGREGVARLTADSLLEGTRQRSGTALTQALEMLGTSIQSEADWDATVVRMTVLTSRLRNTFALLREVLLEPVFPDREVERLKGERLAELIQIESEPRGLADEKFSAVLFGSTARFGKPAGGDRESVSTLTRDDITEFHTSWYTPDNVTIVIAGDIDRAGAEKLVREAFDSWERSSRAAPTAVRDRQAHEDRGVWIVHRGSAPQSELRVGQVSIDRAHPDYFAVVVMNAVLGGLFSSRINLNLREEHGYTYGASSHFDWRRGRSPFVISTAVQSTVTAAAVGEIFVEIDRMRSELITNEELSLATSYLEGVFPIRYETTAAIAAAISTLVVYQLPADFYDVYRANIRAISTQEVQRVADEHLKPEAMQIVIVGDATVVTEPLASLRLGPVRSFGG